MKATKSTMVEALRALKETKYSKTQGEKSGSREEWEKHHKQCIYKITEMILAGRYQ